MQGLGYVLSRDLVHIIAQANDSLRVYTNEDSARERPPNDRLLQRTLGPPVVTHACANGPHLSVIRADHLLVQ